MPRGVYPRTKNQLEATKINLAKGRTKEVRDMVRLKLKENAKDPAWRDKVGEATKAAMWRPDVREKHLAGLEKARSIHGVNFKGGASHGPTKEESIAASVLVPLGFVPEFKVKTNGHCRELNPGGYYVIDFAHLELMIAIELDGKSHAPRKKKERDRIKTAVLESLGWTVIRIRHD